jgi:hypothetical protein
MIQMKLLYNNRLSVTSPQAHRREHVRHLGLIARHRTPFIKPKFMTGLLVLIDVD